MSIGKGGVEVRRRLWIKQTQHRLGLTHADAAWMIEIEGRQARPTDGGAAFDMLAGPDEVLCPGMVAWMEQLHLLAGGWIDGVGAVGFVKIAARAGQGEIFL